MREVFPREHLVRNSHPAKIQASNVATTNWINWDPHRRRCIHLPFPPFVLSRTHQTWQPMTILLAIRVWIWKFPSQLRSHSIAPCSLHLAPSGIVSWIPPHHWLICTVQSACDHVEKSVDNSLVQPGLLQKPFPKIQIVQHSGAWHVLRVPTPGFFSLSRRFPEEVKHRLHSLGEWPDTVTIRQSGDSHPKLNPPKN